MAEASRRHPAQPDQLPCAELCKFVQKYQRQMQLVQRGCDHKVSIHPHRQNRCPIRGKILVIGYKLANREIMLATSSHLLLKARPEAVRMQKRPHSKNGS
jgi:hypothetical protein